MHRGSLPACFSAYSLSIWSLFSAKDGVRRYRNLLALPVQGSESRSSKACRMFSDPPMYIIFMLACITKTPEDAGTGPTLFMSKSSHSDQGSSLDILSHLCAPLWAIFSNWSATMGRKAPTSVTMPMACAVPLSMSLVTTGWLMSTATTLTEDGSMLPTAME